MSSRDRSLKRGLRVAPTRQSFNSGEAAIAPQEAIAKCHHINKEGAIAAVAMASCLNSISKRIALAVAIAAIAVSCTPTENPWAIYRNRRFEFEFPYPQDWVALPPPTNMDGQAFQHPDNPDIEIRGWGSLKLSSTDTSGDAALDSPEPKDYNFTTEQGLPAVLQVEVGKQETTIALTLESGDIIYGWQGRSPHEEFAEYYDVFYYIARNYRVVTPVD